MKKIYTSLMVLAAMVMAISSCTKETDIQKDEKVSGKMKTITVRTDIATRTTLDSNHENIIWSTGDKISLFNNVDNTNSELTYVAGGDLTVTVPDETETIYALYPYYSGNTSGPENASIYISNNQTQKNPGELNGYNYPMVAKGTVSADNKAIISLYPVASALALNIYHTGLSGDETVKEVKVTPASANTGFIGSQKNTDLTGDNIKYSSADKSDPIKVTLTNALSLSKTKPDDKQKFAGQVYVCLAKQNYSNVVFEIKTTKGIYTITSSDTPFDCVNNDFVPVNINLNKATFVEFSVAEGDYVVLSKDNSKYFAMSTNANGTSKRRDLVEFAYNPSSSTSTNDPTLVWTIAKSGSKYTFSGAGVGLFLTAENNIAPLSSSAGEFVITAGSADGTAVISAGSTYLKRNGTYGFGFYTSSEDLYLVPVTYSGNPVLNVDTSDQTLAASDTDTKQIAISSYLYTSISVAAYVDSEGNTLSDWLNVSYENGIVSYNAKSANTSTTEDRNAYIIVTAQNTNGSTLSSPIKVTQYHVYGAASVGETLWAESFTGFDAEEVPTVSNDKTTVYGNGTVNYTCVNGGANTRVLSGNVGVASPELLIGNTNGSFTVSNIPTGSATKMTLSFATNYPADLGVSSPTSGITLTSVADAVYKVEANSGITTFSLVFSNSTGKNIRLDDILVVAGAPQASITVQTNAASATSSAEGKLATLNGAITLVNGAAISEVTEAGFYYKLSSASNYTKVTCSSVSSTSFTYDLAGLTTDSEYTYYAYAVYNNSEIIGQTTTFTPIKSSGPGQITLTYEDIIATSYNESATTFASNSIGFAYINMMRNNSNGTPAGWAKHQVMQTKSGGSIYNIDGLGSISHIRVYLADNTNSFTLYYGNSAQPTTNATSRPNTSSGTEDVTIKTYVNKTEGTGTATLNYYDFDISDASHFRILNGSKSLYIYKIVIDYN